jgi:lysophospholipase L1-like esterase
MNKRRIFVLGDSISIHYGPWLEKMTAHSFLYDRKRGEEQEDLEKGAGANGGDSSLVLDYLREKEAAGMSFDILVVNCGLHDIRVDGETGENQVGIDDYAENLVKIMETAKRMSETVIWAKSTPVVDDIHNTRTDMFKRYSKDLERYNEKADGIAKAFDVPVMDLYGFTKNFGPGAYADHIHFKPHVRKMQAAYICGFLDSIPEKVGAHER